MPLSDIPGLKLTVGGISCVEIDGSGELALKRGGTTGARVFLCDWIDRLDLATNFMGARTGIILDDPELFPELPGLYVQEVKISGFGILSGAPDAFAYDLAKLTVSYGEGSAPSGAFEDRVSATHNIQFGAEIMTLPMGAVKWGDDAYENAGDRLEVESTRLLPQVTHTVSIPSVPFIPDVSSIVGKINTDTFLDVAPNYLLFTGASSRRTLMASGEDVIELELSFAQRVAASWQMIWNPADLEWRTVDPLPYETAAFSDVLEFMVTGLGDV
jgi:hypothetical protein